EQLHYFGEPLSLAALGLGVVAAEGPLGERVMIRTSGAKTQKGTENKPVRYPALRLPHPPSDFSLASSRTLQVGVAVRLAWALPAPRWSRGSRISIGAGRGRLWRRTRM